MFFSYKITYSSISAALYEIRFTFLYSGTFCRSGHGSQAFAIYMTDSPLSALSVLYTIFISIQSGKQFALPGGQPNKLRTALWVSLRRQIPPHRPNTFRGQPVSPRLTMACRSLSPKACRFAHCLTHSQVCHFIEMNLTQPGLGHLYAGVSFRSMQYFTQSSGTL